MALLSVKDLNVYYGVIQAIHGISFEVNEGEVIALIGANGAGKTTILHTITGLVSAKSGSIEFEAPMSIEERKSGKKPVMADLRKTPAHKIVSLGMAHVPEGRRIFQELTVFENLKMGAYTRTDKKEIEDTIQMIYKRFPRLEERKTQIAGTLSGGEQQMLAMGRALMSHPRIILMDEPSMGLSPIFVEEIFNIIIDISKSGTTVLLVEQNAKKALSIADRAYVLETGKIVLEGDAKSMMNNESVKKAYLGE
ncbi:MAG: Phosphonate-transporting ATPase [Herbinix sp.]|jgi:branched-chain amino acid transport system ATP-binding protein|nr:Phosphonate-transporting ATPase [Herbinix sp.]